jgi:uracil-DNA glycosylase
MRKLLKQIKECEHCKAFLPLGPRPVVTAGTPARIAIIGQPPATKVQKDRDPLGRYQRKTVPVLAGVLAGITGGRGTYSQAYYLRNRKKRNLTDTMRAYKEYLPAFFPLPHPSPRNRFWLIKNPWFEEEVIPELQKRRNKML